MTTILSDLLFFNKLVEFSIKFRALPVKNRTNLSKIKKNNRNRL